MMDTSTEHNSQRLDMAPPKPPRQGRSLMSMGDSDEDDQKVSGASSAVQAMMAMGDARKGLIKLGTLLPQLAPALQQFIQGLEQIVPQQVADIVAGNPPGAGGSGMGAPQANAAPTAPPVQSGMP